MMFNVGFWLSNNNSLQCVLRLDVILLNVIEMPLTNPTGRTALWTAHSVKPLWFGEVEGVG